MRLPSVTLVCVDCVNPELAAKVLGHCAPKVEFGAVKLLTDKDIEYPNTVKIPALNSLVSYSLWMLAELHKYIETDHVLIVQRDGWILNPDSFDMEWLNLDYIGPLFIQYDEVGSGGFSLRSRRIMEHAASLLPEWSPDEELQTLQQSKLGFYEDGFLCFDKRFANFNKGTKEQASRFAQGGNRNPEYFVERPFGFHRTWQTIDFKTGIVDSSDTSKDLHTTYDNEIFGL